MPRLLDAPLDSQPQEAVEVDWENPLTSGLVVCFTGVPGATEYNYRPTGAIVPVATPLGTQIGGLSGASYALLEGSRRIDGGPMTCVASLTYVTQGVQSAVVSQGGASAGKGWKLSLTAGSPGRFFLTHGAVADYGASAGTLANGAATVIGVTSSGDGGTARYYLDGVFDSQFSVGTMALPASRDTMIGAAHDGSAFVDQMTGGSVGVVLVWNRELSADEVRSVSANPWQLFRSPVEARIPTSVLLTLALGASLTAAGSISRQARRTLGASLTVAGANAERIARTLSASLAGTASIVRQPRRALAGSVATTATITKQARRALASSITGAGAISRRTARTLAASVTGAGALLKQTSRALAASITSSATASSTKVTLRTLTASLTASAAIVRRPGKALAAGVTASGALSRRTSRAIAASLTAAGTLTKRQARAFGASLTAAGSVTKRAGRTVAAALTVAGSIATEFVEAVITGPGLIRAALTYVARFRSDLTHKPRHNADLTRKPRHEADTTYRSED